MALQNALRACYKPKSASNWRSWCGRICFCPSSHMHSMLPCTFESTPLHDWDCNSSILVHGILRKTFLARGYVEHLVQPPKPKTCQKQMFYLMIVTGPSELFTCGSLDNTSQTKTQAGPQSATVLTDLLEKVCMTSWFLWSLVRLGSRTLWNPSP